MYPTRQLIRTWSCPLCCKPFRRRQDRDRHLPSHLPYWISCTYKGCSWRGYRLDAFRRHWYSEHKPTSLAPDDENGSKLYDPGPLIKKIIQNPISIGDAEFWAVSWVKEQAVALDRQDLLADLWGHKGKDMKGFQPQYPGFLETNALPIISPMPTFSPVSPAQFWVSAPIVPSPYTEARNGCYFYGIT